MKFFYGFLLFFLFSTDLQAQNAYEYIQEGKDKFSRGDYSGAISKLSSAINLNASIPEAYFYRGLSRLSQNAYTSAIEDFNLGIMVVNRLYGNGGSTDRPVFKMGEYWYYETVDPRAYYLARGKAYSALNDSRSAIADFNRALAIDAGGFYAEAMFDRAWEYLKRNEYDKALSDFEQLTSKVPKESKYRYFVGLCHAYKGNHSTAISHYNKAISMNSGEEHYYYSRGYSKFQIEDMAGCEKDMNEALFKNGKNYEALQYRAWARYHLGKHSDAKFDLDQLIDKHNQKTPDNYYYRAMIQIERGELNGAASDFDAAIRLDSRHAPSYEGRARLSMHANNWDKAISDLTRAIEAHPSFWDAYFKRGVCYYSSGKFQQAISDFNRVISNFPNHTESYLYRGAAKVDSGDRSGGCADARKARELGHAGAADFLERQCK